MPVVDPSDLNDTAASPNPGVTNVDLIAQLKAEWCAAKYTPEQDGEHDEELAYEEAQMRSIVETSTFPSREELLSWVLHAYPQFEGILPQHTNLVYASVAKIFYATCTDACREKVRAVGEELNAAGGLKLMQCAYYAFSIVAVQAAGAKGPGWDPFGRVMHRLVASYFDGIGDWLE